MNFRFFFILSILAFSLTGCDHIEGPFSENYIPPADTSSPQLQNILLEDFTAHTCGYCPGAAKKAQDLQQIYGDRLIIVATHMGSLAEPQNNSNGSYAYDFRTTAGNEIDAYFSISDALPKGMVNRKSYNNKLILGKNDWASAIGQLIDDTAAASIEITNTYNTVSRQLNIDVKLEYFKPGTSSDKLVVLLTEDSIVNWQLDYDLPPDQENIPDYVHRHVLRKAITPVFGVPLSSTPIEPGTTFTKNFSVILDNEYKDGHCEIIVFLQNDQDKTIYQAAEEPVR